jgi:hypothetical protein
MSRLKAALATTLAARPVYPTLLTTYRVPKLAALGHHGTDSGLTLICGAAVRASKRCPNLLIFSCFDAALGPVGTDETEREAAQDGHVL